MNRIGRILVVPGGTPYAETATRTAVELAQRHKAEVTGVTLVNMAHLRNVGPVPIGAGAMADELREHRETTTHSKVDQCVDHFRDECGKARIRYEVLHEERDRPFDYVISQARYHDLVLFGLRGIFEFGVTGEADNDPSLTSIRLLASAQQWNADLIVMGNSERTLVLRRMLGETMLQTVRTADRPLFLFQ